MPVLCHICGAPDAAPHRSIQSPFLDASYTLFRCGACGSAFFDADEHAIDLAEFYNRSEFSAPAAPFVRSRAWDGQVRQITVLLGRRPGPYRILDVGSRTGDFLLHWDPVHGRTGVELNAANAALARERGLDVHCEKAEHLRFERPFTVVTCFAVLEHIPRPRPFLEALASLVEPGGVLTIMVPFYDSWLRRRLDRTGTYWHMYAPPGHVSYYSRSFLDSFYGDRGFKLVRRYYSSGGMAANYAPWSPGVRLLKEGSFASLRSYFEHAIQGRPLPRVARPLRVLQLMHHAAVELAEQYTPLTRVPYYDHLYSYYVKQ